MPAIDHPAADHPERHSDDRRLFEDAGVTVLEENATLRDGAEATVREIPLAPGV